MRYDARFLVRLWMIGFMGALLIQSIFQERFAASTAWAYSAGWQSEIAIWNLGVICMLIPLLRKEEHAKKVVPGLVILSLLFGLNHLRAAFGAPRVYLGNWLGACSNLLAIGLGVVACRRFFWTRQD